MRFPRGLKRLDGSIEVARGRSQDAAALESGPSELSCGVLDRGRLELLGELLGAADCSERRVRLDGSARETQEVRGGQHRSLCGKPSLGLLDCGLPVLEPELECQEGLVVAADTELIRARAGDRAGSFCLLARFGLVAEPKSRFASMLLAAALLPTDCLLVLAIGECLTEPFSCSVDHGTVGCC